MPSSKDIIRFKRTGRKYKIMGDGQHRMSEYWMLRVLNEDDTYAPSTAMLAHSAWSEEWEVVK